MKKEIAILLFVVLCQVVYSQNSAAEIDQRVAGIQKSLSTCQRIEQVRTATAFREVYLKDGQVCLVHVKSFENDTDKDVSWYFDKQNLVYCETSWVDFRGIVTFSESHYLSENQLLKWIENTETIQPESDKFKERAELLKIAGEELLTKVGEK